jgi:exopolyphosphatase / guanosine-5'-triphosphate,3'-diphosphate pyrophosphatase
LDYLKFASIDIGSNAIRFLLSYVFETERGPFFRKGILLRVPLRLGEDAFKLGEISKDKEEKLIHTMHSFRHLMVTQDIIAYKAFATSAMRDASNNVEIVEHIKEHCDIEINVISGDEEANIISGHEIPRYLRARNKMLFVDVGGGSTEFTYHNNQTVIRQSFNVGTIRLMYDSSHGEDWKSLNNWLDETGLKGSSVPILGSGGNINKIYKIKRRRTTDLHITAQNLRDFYQEVSSLTEVERVLQYQLNPDRADVIVPACEIFLNIIDITQTKVIYVPKTGLSDGIVRTLYEQYKES